MAFVRGKRGNLGDVDSQVRSPGSVIYPEEHATIVRFATAANVSKIVSPSVYEIVFSLISYRSRGHSIRLRAASFLGFLARRELRPSEKAVDAASLLDVSVPQFSRT